MSSVRGIAIGALLAILVTIVAMAIANPNVLATELQGGGDPSNKTLAGCPRDGYAEILVGYSFRSQELGQPFWMRYCVFGYTDPSGRETYGKYNESFWSADTRCTKTANEGFYPGEVVALKDSTAYAYYEYYDNGWKFLVVNGPGFFMRSKGKGFVTGNACINPPFEDLKKLSYLENELLPPPANFVFPDHAWLDMAKAIQRESCQKPPLVFYPSYPMTHEDVVYPECLGPNLSGKAKLIARIPRSWPFAPTPPQVKGKILLASEVKDWCVGGYCNEQRFVGNPERNVNGVITGFVVHLKPGLGLLMSIPKGVWASYSTGTDNNGNKIMLTAYGPEAFYAEEANFYLD